VNEEELDEAENVPGGDEGSSAVAPGEAARSPRAVPAVVRGVVVLGLAAIGYQLLIPQTVVVTSRLSQLALQRTGVHPFEAKPSGRGVQSAAQSGIPALQAAASRSPSRTGLYSVEWSPSQTSGTGLIVFLLPTDAQARTVLSQIQARQLTPNAYAANSLIRKSTLTVSGVAGSAGAFFIPSTTAGATAPSLAVGLFRYGRVVAVTEVLEPANAIEHMNAIAQKEHAHLAKTEPGFSMEVVRHPIVATVLWVVGAVVLAAVAALAPFLRRRLADRRERRIQEELERRVVVRGQVITKRRL
jgi:hypothetical protein